MPEETANKATPGTSIVTRLRPFTGVIALVVLCVVFGSRERAFLSGDNFFNILNAMAIVGILAVGQAFPLIGGGFDLSQGAVASLSAAVAASMLSRHGMPLGVAIPVGLVLGAALGAFNGWLVSGARVHPAVGGIIFGAAAQFLVRFGPPLGVPAIVVVGVGALVGVGVASLVNGAGINPFVATLGTQIAFFGLTNVYTDNHPQALGPQADLVRQFAFGTLGKFYYSSLLFLTLVLGLAFVLRCLPFGQHVYTLGGNEEASRLAGINTTRMKVVVYALSGLLASVGGMVMMARNGQASPVAGAGLELQSLASCIVGGIALGGGLGGAWNVLLGAVTLGVVDNGLQMATNSPNWRPVIQGAIILLAVAVDARARQRR